MRKVQIMIAIMVLGISLQSCKKFEDGGLVKKADKSIVNGWKLSTYLRNDVDETSLLYITNYMEQYNEDGSYERSYQSAGGDLISETGTYSFSSDNTTLNVSGVSSIGDFSEANSSVSSSSYTILKLNKDEYWYSYENGGDLHEFRLNLQ